MAGQPRDGALVEYVTARFRDIFPRFADAEAVGEAIALNRDLWVALYLIDHGAHTPAFDAEP